MDNTNTIGVLFFYIRKYQARYPPPPIGERACLFVKPNIHETHYNKGDVIMSKQTKLHALFTYMKNEGKAVRYGDVLRSGVSIGELEATVKQYNASISRDEEGYSIIVFNFIKKG